MSFDMGGAGSGAMSGASAGAAFGPWGAAVGGVAGGLIGGLSGGGEENQKRALQAQQDALKYLQGIDPNAQNDWAGASENPADRAAQLGFMGQMQEAASNNGMDLQSRVAMQQAEDEANRNARANTLAIMSDAEQRGMAGGGNELASRLVSQQGNSNAVAQAGATASSAARQRALQAMQYGGQEANSIRQGDQGFQTSKLNAANNINQFNAQNRMNQGSLVATAYGNLATAYNGRAGQQYGMSSGLGRGIGGALGMAGQNFANNTNTQAPATANAPRTS
jgi:hypothetical protein